MSRNMISALIVGMSFSAATGALSQEIDTCDLHRGSANSKIECLARMVRSLNDKVTSLEAQFNNYSRPEDLSDYVRRSELETVLSGYVRYHSSLGINLLVEPSTSQNTGRCLEAYPGETGVIAHKPCNFDSKQELKWQLLPAPRTEAERQ